jgi:chaperonin GroES
VGASSSPTARRKNPRRERSSPWAKANRTTKAKVFPLDVKAGDRVLFGKYSGTEIKIDGEELLIMREEEVLGILKK